MEEKKNNPTAMAQKSEPLFPDKFIYCDNFHSAWAKHILALMGFREHPNNPVLDATIVQRYYLVADKTLYELASDKHRELLLNRYQFDRDQDIADLPMWNDRTIIEQYVRFKFEDFPTVQNGEWQWIDNAISKENWDQKVKDAVSSVDRYFNFPDFLFPYIKTDMGTLFFTGNDKGDQLFEQCLQYHIDHYFDPALESVTYLETGGIYYGDIPVDGRDKINKFRLMDGKIDPESMVQSIAKWPQIEKLDQTYSMAPDIEHFAAFMEEWDEFIPSQQTVDIAALLYIRQKGEYPNFDYRWPEFTYGEQFLEIEDDVFKSFKEIKEIMKSTATVLLETDFPDLCQSQPLQDQQVELFPDPAPGNSIKRSR